MNPDAVVLGVPIDPVTLAGAVDRIGDFIECGRRHGRTHQVSTVNVDFLVNALDAPDLHSMLQSNELNLADGAPVVWAARALRTALPERVAGADLVPELVAASGERGWRVHLFGGANDVAARALGLLRRRYPDALVTADAGPLVPADGHVDDRVIEEIVAQGADILCVALGNPKQERFIARNRERLGCPVQIGVGGSLDMLLGDRVRAPRFVQQVGAEWVSRAAQEPARLGRRYFNDLRVAVPAFASYIRKVREQFDGEQLGVEVVAGRARVGGAGRGDAAEQWERFDPQHVEEIEIDLQAVGRLGPTAHGRLVRVVREARRRDLPMSFLGCSPAAHASLEAYGTVPLLLPHG